MRSALVAVLQEGGGIEEVCSVLFDLGYTRAEVDSFLRKEGVYFPKPWPHIDISELRKMELQTISLDL